MKNKAIIICIILACVSDVFSQDINWKSENRIISSGKVAGQYQFRVGKHELLVKNTEQLTISIDGIESVQIVQNMLESIAFNASIWGESYFQVIKGIPADIKMNFSFNTFYGRYYHIINIVLDRTEDYVLIKTILIEGYNPKSGDLPEDLYIYFFDEMVSLEI